MSEPVATYTPRQICTVCGHPLTLCTIPNLFEGDDHAYYCGRCDVAGPYRHGTDKAIEEYNKLREVEDD